MVTRRGNITLTQLGVWVRVMSSCYPGNNGGNIVRPCVVCAAPLYSLPPPLSLAPSRLEADAWGQDTLLVYELTYTGEGTHIHNNRWSLLRLLNI